MILILTAPIKLITRPFHFLVMKILGAVVDGVITENNIRKEGTRNENMTVLDGAVSGNICCNLSAEMKTLADDFMQFI